MPGAYRVCLLTGDAGEDASGRHDNPDLLGHTYVGPYLAADDGLNLVVVDSEGVCGYLLATADTTRFERWREAEWLPALRAQYPIGSGTPRDGELRLGAELRPEHYGDLVHVWSAGERG